MASSTDILFSCEYIKNVLYFAVIKNGKVPKNTARTHYFTTDDELVYENYYNDFGPLKLGCVYKYCQSMNEKLRHYLHKQRIVHYTSADPKKKANAAFLLACYGVLNLSISPKDALRPLLIEQTYRPFQDAVPGVSCYTITLTDCVNAIKKAKDLGFFNFYDFNYDEYEKLDQIHGGDRNWIVPGKFLAFIGPVDHSCSCHSPEMYITYFKQNNVNVVIRLNEKMYDENVFKIAGIRHYDLFFTDGRCPPRNILLKFLQISEKTQGAIAVHCKAGLGRTGSLIGCYLIKHYRMTAREAIGWMRISRPGSVIGHQQEFLEKLEPLLIRQGDTYRQCMYQDRDKIPAHDFGVYSLAENSFKYRPITLDKSPSPPLPVQRHRRLETEEIRPQASKIRPVPKMVTKEQHVLIPNNKSTHIMRESRQRVVTNIRNNTSSNRKVESGDSQTNVLKTKPQLISKASYNKNIDFTGRSSSKIRQTNPLSQNLTVSVIKTKSGINVVKVGLRIPYHVVVDLVVVLALYKIERQKKHVQRILLSLPINLGINPS